MFNFLRRNLRAMREKPQPLPPPMPPFGSCGCDSRLPFERLYGDRYLCPGCAREFWAVQDTAGDWVFDRRPLRLVRRASAAR